MDKYPEKYIFDDGSLEFKVLQRELAEWDPVVIKVGKYNLNEWLVDVIEEDDNIKFCYLHFCTGSLIRTDVDIKADVAAALHNYPNIRIILPFEQQDKPSIERKAKNYGIVLENESPQPPDINKLIEENKEKFHFVEYSDYKGEQTKQAEYNSEDSFKIKKEEFKDKRRRKKKE